MKTSSQAQDKNNGTISGQSGSQVPSGSNLENCSSSDNFLLTFVFARSQEFSPLQFAIKSYSKDIHFVLRKYSFVIQCWEPQSQWDLVWTTQYQTSQQYYPLTTDYIFVSSYSFTEIKHSSIMEYDPNCQVMYRDYIFLWPKI